MWHTVLLLLATAVCLWLIVLILSKIWLWIIGALIIGTGVYVAVVWSRRHRNRW
jgi:Flp pilus assembly protein TadB